MSGAVAQRAPASAEEAASRVVAVVIGRNEGATLGDCLDQCRLQCRGFVYVDSGSTDDSPERARARGGEVLELGVLTPFRPGFARNRGFARVEQAAKEMESEFIQFVDADCVLQPGWVASAVAAMDADPRLEVVFGQLDEVDATSSPWKRMCQIEWSGPAGPAQWCGGIFLIRRDTFRAARGFREDLLAGEEPELCSRLRAQGGGIERLDVPMARHESHMLRFSQWLRREYRGGFMDFSVRIPDGSQPFARERFQTYAWTLGWLALCAALVLAGSLPGGAAGAWLGLLVGVGLIPLQMLRQVRWCRRKGHDSESARIYGVLVVLLNWPKLVGQLCFLWQRHGASPSRRGAA